MMSHIASASGTRFREKLLAAAQRNASWLCVGLDPVLDLIPENIPGASPGARVAAFLEGVIEATSDLVCCYKPNLAFFEALGDEGLAVLSRVRRAIPSPIPAIADAKRGDIGHTSRAYAEALFDRFDFDAATVSPYLGGDALEPFFAYPDRGVFVLCKTSNPGAGEIQDLPISRSDGSTEPLYAAVARQALTWDRHGTLGLVVGATYPDELRAVRAIARDVPILIPGVGPQAGDLEAAVRNGADHDGGNAIVNASRGVLYAGRADGALDASRAAAEELRRAINAARPGPGQA